MTPRKILHLDLDAFFCAVEELRDPSLRGKPFAVGGQPNTRGVVASCSYAARQYGVRSAMPMGKARSLCPQLLIVPHHFTEYREKSRTVMEILSALTPLVEQLSIDEAFLDVTALPEPGESLARSLQTEIKIKVSLPSSLGVATNKLIAKIANNVGKASSKSGNYPNAIQVVPPGQEAAFIAPLPAEALWGVGPKTAARLAELGLHTIGDIAAWPSNNLAHRFGQIGHDLARRAKGIDERPIETTREAKSISQEVTFSRDTADEGQLLSTLLEQSHTVHRSLLKDNLFGGTVKLKMRWSDFTTITRQSTLPHPTNEAKLIYQTALNLFHANWKPGKPLRLLGVGISGLQPPSRQLSLWDIADHKKAAQLQTAVNQLHARFGTQSIRKASDLGKRS